MFSYRWQNEPDSLTLDEIETQNTSVSTKSPCSLFYSVQNKLLKSKFRLESKLYIAKFALLE
jgi:hypothetical protein